MTLGERIEYVKNTPMETIYRFAYLVVGTAITAIGGGMTAAADFPSVLWFIADLVIFAGVWLLVQFYDLSMAESFELGRESVEDED